MPKDMGDDFGSDFDAGMASDSGKKLFGGVSVKWENILPIAVIIIVLLLVVFKTNILSGGASFLNSGSGVRILVLGSPNQEFRNILSDQENKDLIKEVRYMTLDSIQHNPVERIKGYNIIVLDQSMQTDKSISRRTADAITSYVKKGGKLIIVLNSGIQRPDDVSVLGWQANFGDIVPVSCDVVGSRPSCLQPIDMQGTLYAVMEEHPIMSGILQVPAVETSGPIRTRTFDVQVVGKEVAYLEDPRVKKPYVAIAEQSLIMGKVIYFNFNPGISKAIVINTIKYLK
jgi:hypothetical protein